VIRTFGSRAGRLSKTNKHFLQLESDCLLDLDKYIKKSSRDVLIDIGFGDGISLSHDIMNNSEILFIGIETYKKGISRMIEFYETKQIKNLLLHNGCAKEFIENLKTKVKFVRIHFPDPWPKNKHSKRRLVSINFLQLLAQIMKPDGLIQIITDSNVYQQHIKEVLRKQNFFEQISIFPINYAVSTFHKKGMKKNHKIKEFNLKVKII
tara:strand:+ start:12225 stop:12848 length:624 start_codon:yes stop_codon:yes gene_type:complete